MANNLNEIIPKSALDGIKAVDTAIVSVDGNLKKLVSSADILSASLKKGGISFEQLAKQQKIVSDNSIVLTAEQKKLETIEKNLAVNTDKVVEARLRAAAATKDQKSKIQELINEENKELGTEQKLENQNKKLIAERKRLNTDTAKGTKRLKEINAQLDKNNAKLKKNKSQLEQQKIGVGSYTTSIKAALSQLGFMPPALTQAAAAAGTLGTGLKGAAAGATLSSKAMKVLKIALISTGIGAIVVALGSLIAYLNDTASGTGRLAKAMAPLKAIFSTIVSLAKNFGEALALFADGEWDEGFKLLKDGVSGASDEYSRHLAIQKSVAELELQLHERRKNSILSLQQLATEQRKQLADAKDATKSIDERLAAQQKAISIEKQIAEERQAISSLEVAILAQQSQLSEDSREEEIALEEARAAHSAIIEQLNKRMATYNAYLESLTNKSKSAANAQADLSGEMVKMQQVTSDTVIAMQYSRAEEEIIVAEYTAEKVKAIEEKKVVWAIELEEKITATKKEQQEKRLGIASSALNAISQIGNTLFEAEQGRIDALSIKNANAKARELEQAAGNQEQINAINEKYAKKEAELKKKQAEQNKKTAVFNAIIGIAQGVISAMTLPPPASFIFAGITAALGAIQLATIASQPIPEFYKGTDSAPGGLISVGERGRELIETKSGALFMATQPTITSGLQGAKIHSNAETERIMNASTTGHDSQDLRSTLERNNNRLIETIKNKRELHINPRKGTITERQGQYYKTYKSRYFK